MKKMQCEVCGGTTIKKIGESMFECQSCGVQYGKEEVKKLLVEITGEVKIDHSRDAENMLKRAKQFEDRGDQEKAQEYYEKALDYDPENEEANEAVKEVSKMAKKILILESDIDDKKAEKTFLDKLGNTTQITPELFSNIKIIFEEKTYYPFAIMSNKVKGTFTATACYKKDVKYYDSQSSQYKYKTEYEKKPANGFFTTSVFGTYSMSIDLLSYVFPYPARLVDDVDINSSSNDPKIFSAKIFKKLEKKSEEIITNNTRSMKYIDLDRIEKINEKSFYNGLGINFSLGDESWKERAPYQHVHKVNDECRYAAKHACPGDYCEKISFDKTENIDENFIVYLPIQLIKYSFKNKTYIAIQFLHSSCNEVAATFPQDITSHRLTKQLEEKNQELNKAQYDDTLIDWGLKILIGAVLLGATLGGVFLSMTFDIDVGYFGGLMIFAIIGAVIGIPMICMGNSKKQEALQQAQQAQKELAEADMKSQKTLTKIYKVFSEEYNRTWNISIAAQKVENEFKFGTNTTDASIAFSDFSNDTYIGTSYGNSNIVSTSDESKIFVCIENIGQNKLQVISLLTKELGIGLAEAKSYTDNIPSNIHGFNTLHQAFKFKNDIVFNGATARVIYKGDPCIIYWGNDIEEVPLKEMSQIELYFDRLIKTRHLSEDLLTLIDENGNVIETAISDSMEPYVHYNNKLARDLSDDEVLFLLKAFFERKVLTIFNQFNWEDFDDISIF